MFRVGEPRILILGAGCAGLGAAVRLRELGHERFHILEKEMFPGGLSASFRSQQGFVWDVGGHVLFSHYDYFDELMDSALGQEWLEHKRDAQVSMLGKLVPYPFQNNLHHLPRPELLRCIRGLVREAKRGDCTAANFREWGMRAFGEGIFELFFLPYNRKVWAHPLDGMGYSWIGERVSTVDLERTIDGVLGESAESSWGPNATFRFPRNGGTGAIWRAVAAMLPQERLSYATSVVRVDALRRIVTSSDGREWPYDVLISTLPLDLLIDAVGDDALREAGEQLRYSSTWVVGIGLEGSTPDHLRSRCWIYFPEETSPFYRVTVFSNYSPNNCPSRHWSLMAETAESGYRLVNPETIVAETVLGMRSNGLLDPTDRIIEAWTYKADRGYPIPTLTRDQCLDYVVPRLETLDIYSRGRFGMWRYEVGNQDHACMQGVEIVDRVLLGIPETTIRYPTAVNSGAGRRQLIGGVQCG